MTEPATPPTNKPVVLIVDDDHAVCAALRRAFSRVQEITPVSVNTGDDALHAIQTLPVILVILDGLLIGETGIEIADRLRAAGYIGPIAAHTTEGSETVRKMLKSGRCDFLLSKPSDPSVLWAAARWALRKSQRDKIRIISIESGRAVSDALHHLPTDRGMNIHLVEAANMREVVQRLDPKPDPMFDVIVVDLDMPEFPAILNLLCALRDQGFQGPIFGRTDRDTESLQLPEGVFGIITYKNLAPNKLGETIHDQLRRAHIIF